MTLLTKKEVEQFLKNASSVASVDARSALLCPLGSRSHQRGLQEERLTVRKSPEEEYPDGLYQLRSAVTGIENEHRSSTSPKKTPADRLRLTESALFQ